MEAILRRDFLFFEKAEAILRRNFLFFKKAEAILRRNFLFFKKAEAILRRNSLFFKKKRRRFGEGGFLTRESPCIPNTSAVRSCEGAVIARTSPRTSYPLALLLLPLVLYMVS